MKCLQKEIRNCQDAALRPSLRPSHFLLRSLPPWRQAAPVQPNEDEGRDEGGNRAAEEMAEGEVPGGVAQHGEVGEGGVYGEDHDDQPDAGGPGAFPRDEAHGLGGLSFAIVLSEYREITGLLDRWQKGNSTLHLRAN